MNRFPDHTSERPLVFLDVDGVLNALRSPKKTSGWGNWFRSTHWSEADGVEFQLDMSRDMGDAIHHLFTRVHPSNVSWLTTWQDEANDSIGARLGWGPLPVVNFTRRVNSDIAKVTFMRSVLTNPGPPVVWMDDTIPNTVDVGPLVDDFTSFERFDPTILDPHNRLLMVVPNASIGLTKEHLEVIEEFLGMHVMMVPKDDTGPTE